MRKIIPSAVLATVLGLAAVTAQAARDHIVIVGSSTVYPFSTVVAERFGKGTRFKTPKVEATGSGGGLKLFCAGVGVEHPDITNSSRKIKSSEIEMCAANGVREIVEVKIGYDGIAVASSRKGGQVNLTLKDIFLALAKEIPDPANPGKLVPNPHQTWQDVNPELPAHPIEVLAHHRQVVLQEQVVIAVDTARQRVFDRDQAALALAADDAREDPLERFARDRRVLGTEMLEHRGFRIRAGLTLECDLHAWLNPWRRRASRPGWRCSPAPANPPSAGGDRAGQHGRPSGSGA